MKKLLAITALITLTALFLLSFPNQHNKEKHFAGRAEYAIQDTHGFYSKSDVETRGRAEFA
ncbi:hypothetical protein ACMXZI_18775 [Bacillus subtilis]|uniref:hypothetical protein n=1 Tax=Bacillus subtilis TaxID=1423 RepID=UPI0039E5D89C